MKNYFSFLQKEVLTIYLGDFERMIDKVDEDATFVGETGT